MQQQLRHALSSMACDLVRKVYVFLRQARALAEAAGGAPQLLPHYARVAATLAQVFPDVAPPLVAALEDEFAALQAAASTSLPSMHVLALMCGHC